jgi:hypothetical protein
MSHPNKWSGLGCLAIMTALGCADETVNLGGGSVGQEIQRGVRCRESPIVDGSVRVTSQAEMEDLAGCEEIDGDLLVDIFAGADLSPLASLRIIGGALELGAYPDSGAEGVTYEEGLAIDARLEEILAAGYLPSLTGLEGLEQAASLFIHDVAAPDLTPLRSLRKLIGRSVVWGPGMLAIQRARVRDLEGLENIQGVQDLGLVDNPELESLAGLVLDERPRNVEVIGSPKLTSLPELAGLSYVYHLQLSDLGIVNLDSLESLLYVETSIWLRDNRALENVDRLTGVTAAELLFEKNPVLRSIPALPEMSGLELFSATQNDALESIALELPTHGAGPDSIQTETLIDPIKVIDIGRNPKLGRVSLAAGLEQARLLAIYENPSLTSISLGTLKRLEELRIVENVSLDSVDVGAVQTIGSLLVTDNPSLDTVGLAAMRTFSTTLEGNASDPVDAGAVDAGP